MFKWMQKLVGKFTGSVETTAEIPLTFTVEEEKILEPAVIPQEIIQVEEPLIVDIHPPTNVPEPPIVEEHKDTDDTYVEKMSTRDNYDFERSQFIKDVRSEYEPWQEHIVPDHICVDMVAQIPDADTTLWLVLFSPEFLETMIYDKCIARERIMFFGDDIELLKTVKLLYQVKVKSGNVISRDLTQLAQTLQEGIKDMQFDKLVVVGNPPYQKPASETGGPAATLYQEFTDIIINKLTPDYFTFIIPSRWMVGGMGLDTFRKNMVSSSCLSKITHFPGQREIFPTVLIPGGVSYFLWEGKRKEGVCVFTVGNTETERDLSEYDIVVQDNKAYHILQKVISKNSNAWVDSRTYGAKPFGLPTNFSKWIDKEGIRCLSSKSREIFQHCSPDAYTDKHSIFKKWKVCVSAARGEGDWGENQKVLSYVLILPPETICTESYIVVGAFEKEEEALNFNKYLKTKFFRFMLGLRVLTQHINKKKFSWIPDLQDYSKPWTDAELYTMFGLSDEECAYIESKIKPLD